MTPPTALPPAPPPVADETDLLAAEYALGLLEGADLARAAHLANTSPAFAAQLAAWQAKLAGLADEVPPIPTPNLLPKIEAKLFGRRKRGFVWPAWARGWLASLLGTGAMAALSVLVVAFMLNLGGTGPDTPLIQTATLAAAGSEVQFLARLEGASLTLSRIHGAAPATGRSYELWLIDGDRPPQSLGLIEAALTLPAPTAAKGYVLAVTDEPIGGAPAGVATGPVIALGQFLDH